MKAETPYQRHVGLEHRNVSRYSPNGFDVIDECADCQLCFLHSPFQEYPHTIYRYPMEQKRREAETCTICGQSAYSPYRSYNPQGHIVEGCVDQFHTPAFEGIVSESARWHHRKEARDIRKRLAKGRQGKGY